MGLYDRDYMRDNYNRKSVPRIVVVLSVVVSLIVASSYLLKELRYFARSLPKRTTHKVLRPKELDPLLAISPLDLNTATHAELALLPHVDQEMATGIMGLRPIDSIDQLDDVYGIGPKRLSVIRPHVFVDIKSLKSRFPDHKLPSETAIEQKAEDRE